MINIVDKLSGTQKKIGANLIALGFVQVTNFVIPIITFPYLVRVVGIDKYGTVSYALTILVYLITVTDYGFGISATREVAQNKNNCLHISALFFNVLAAKIFLLLIVTIGLAGGIIIYPRFGAEPIIYSSGFLYILGNVLLPTWFFQGVERMKYITYLNIISKLLILILLFLFIKERESYRYVVFIYGVANTLTGILGTYLAIKKEKLELRIPTIAAVKNQLTEGWAFFALSLSSLISNSSTIVILGFYVNDSELGKYSIAEKVTFLLWQLLIIVSQAMYPHVCQLAGESHERLVGFVKKIAFSLSFTMLFLCIALFGASEYLVYLITGSYQADIALVLKILSFNGFIVSLNIPFYQTLLAYKLQKHTANIFNIMVFVSVFLTVVLCWKAGIIGAAVVVVLTQTIIVLSLIVLLEYKFPQYSLWRTISKA
ncbi:MULTISPECIES: oligosaccharide flippase family protein [Spirosoma]|uniref:Flippase n=1 Tax=Spirosoma sordidisoli TaxID=2502893 RepID=A0A4Q2ULH6_9BACT|nr:MULTISPECIES: oligosaccharide flippase family protein [Spirosoma]RYC68541.1 hypothetical protein EQG79_19530 [Spirosoma sordidisoli]